MKSWDQVGHCVTGEATVRLRLKTHHTPLLMPAILSCHKRDAINSSSIKGNPFTKKKKDLWSRLWKGNVSEKKILSGGIHSGPKHKDRVGRHLSLFVSLETHATIHSHLLEYFTQMHSVYEKKISELETIALEESYGIIGISGSGLDVKIQIFTCWICSAGVHSL